MAVRSSSVLSSTVSKDERHVSPEKEVWGGFSLFTPFPKEAFKFPLENRLQSHREMVCERLGQ